MRPVPALAAEQEGSTHGIKVDNGRDELNVLERELRALGHHVPVHHDARTPVCHESNERGIRHGKALAKRGRNKERTKTGSVFPSLSLRSCSHGLGYLTVVEAPPVAALLVGVQVDPASLACGAADQVQPRVELAQLHAKAHSSDKNRSSEGRSRASSQHFRAPIQEQET